MLVDLLAVSRDANDTDAAAEVLVTAALVGEQEMPYYREGISWLLGRQRADGTFVRAPASVATGTRCSWGVGRSSRRCGTLPR